MHSPDDILLPSDPILVVDDEKIFLSALQQPSSVPATPRLPIVRRWPRSLNSSAVNSPSSFLTS